MDVCDIGVIPEHKDVPAIGTLTTGATPMTDQPIDPAATPEDPDAPEIAADDAGASAIAERAGKQAVDDEEDIDGDGI